MEVHWGKAEQTKYLDPRTNLPVAPRSVNALMKREQEHQEIWWQAIDKEVNGLKAA